MYSTTLAKMQANNVKLAMDYHKNPLKKRIVAQPGLNKGLTVVLDAHSNSVSSGTVFDNFRGFVATIEPPNQFPLTTKTNVLLQPGKINGVAMSVVNIEADPGIKRKDVSKRNCFFPNESQATEFVCKEVLASIINFPPFALHKRNVTSLKVTNALSSND